MRRSISIIVTCSPEQVPQPLVEQLREGGRIVVPLGERYQQTLFSLVKRDGKLEVESREPTFFVPMTGKAEVAAPQSVERAVHAAGERRLRTDARSRQAGRLVLSAPSEARRRQRAGSRPGIAWRSAIACPGRGAQALQALGVDGRQVSELVVDAWAKASDVRQGQSSEQRAQILVSFFDDDRAPVGQQSLGPWTGTFDWTHKTARLRVPPDTRVAIVAIGLLGATGEVSFDDIAIRAAGAAKSTASR